MITGPVNHGLYIILSYKLTSPSLHVIYQLHPSIFIVSTISFFIYHLIIAIISSLLYRLSHQSVLAFSEAEVLYVICGLNKQFFLIVDSQKKTICRPTPFWIQ